MDNPLVVELYGPAGSGKSSCLAPLRDALENEGITVRTSQDGVSIWALMRRPNLLKVAISFARYSKNSHSELGLGESGEGPKFFSLYLVFTRVLKSLRNWLLYLDGDCDILLLEHGEYFFRADQALYGVRPIKNSSPPTEICIGLSLPETEIIERVRNRGIKKGPESSAIISQVIFRQRYLKSFETVIRGLDSRLVSTNIVSDKRLETVVEDARAFLLSSFRKAQIQGRSSPLKFD